MAATGYGQGNGTREHRSESTEQLDRLLAGLDELSGNLPDLANGRINRGVIHFPNRCENVQSSLGQGFQKAGQSPSLTPERKPSDGESEWNTSKFGVHNNTGLVSVSMPPTHQTKGGEIMTKTQPQPERRGRSYEDSVDYVLDSDADMRKISDGSRTSTRGPEPQSYHTRYDSKPFSYIRQSPSASPSRLASRVNSHEKLDVRGQGLESPSLLRKVLHVNSSETESCSNFNKVDNKYNNGANPGLSVPIQVISSRNGFPDQTSRGQSSDKEVQPNRGGNLTNSTFISALKNASSVLEESLCEIDISIGGNVTQSDSNDTKSLDNIFGNRSEEERLKWLQNQQKKLHEKREEQKKTTQESAYLIKELESSLLRARSGVGSETTDGYASEANSLLFSETSRESSPAKIQDNNFYEKSESTLQQDILQTTAYSVSQFNFNHEDIYSYQQSLGNTKTKKIQESQKAPEQNTAVSSIFQTNDENSLSTMYFNNAVYHGESKCTELQHQQHHQEENVYSSVKKRSQPQKITPARAREMKACLVSRQQSDSSFDRKSQSKPFIQRKRADSDSEAQLVGLIQYKHGSVQSNINGSSNFQNSSEGNGSLQSVFGSAPGSRSETPGFPAIPSTPYFNHTTNTLPPKSPVVFNPIRNGCKIEVSSRAHSPAGSLYQGEALTLSRRGSVSSELTDVSATYVKLVKENCKYWYKQNITRDEAISVLSNQPPGTFIVRVSNSFPGAFGLALKVCAPPVQTNGLKSSNGSCGDSSELIRHFLIESTSKGVKLKGYSNEPMFTSLSALIYQHTITPLALPTRLVLPQNELGESPPGEVNSANKQMQQLLQHGAACNLYYLFTMDTDQLTGPAAVRKTISQLFLTRPVPSPTVVHFKVSGQGITLTDQARKLFFRKHYPVSQISHCGIDPEDRRWSLISDQDTSSRLFGFVARKPANRSCNQCHVLAELDLDQPARAIVNFVNKLMLAPGSSSKLGSRAADLV